jgi:hypothetical protein
MNIKSMVFDKRFNLITTFAAAAFGMYFFKKLLNDDLRGELSRFSLVNKHRDSPLSYVDATGTIKQISNLDDFIKLLGPIQICEQETSAARTFYSAKRVATLGWVDQYTIRCAEFLASRSLEQHLATVYKPTTKFNTLLNKIKRNVSLMQHLKQKFGDEMNGEIDEIKDDRNFFAHRDDYSKMQQPFNYRLFLLVSEIINYSGPMNDH